MEHQLLIDICGWVASLGLIFGYLPQAVQTMRTRRTEGISLPGFVSMAVGAVAFMVQGLLTGNYYLFGTNLITCVCSVVIFGIKMNNDYFSKGKGERVV